MCTLMCTLVTFVQCVHVGIFLNPYLLLCRMFEHNCLDTCSFGRLLCILNLYCICTCSAQVGMLHMERRSRNMLIIITIIVIIIIIIIISSSSSSSSSRRRRQLNHGSHSSFFAFCLFVWLFPSLFVCLFIYFPSVAYNLQIFKNN